MEGNWKGVQTAAGLFALCLVLLCPSPGHAGVDVNINIGPPAVVVAGPPEMIVIPRTMVYFAPDVGVDLFFSAGYWWTPKEGRWFRARAYNGPWVVVEHRHVPVEIVRLPRDYRRVYVREKRVPYGQLKKHWEHRRWERRERRGEWKGWKEERGGHGRGHGRRGPR